MNPRMLRLALAFPVLISGLLVGTVHADPDPGNNFQRFRFPWVDDGTQKAVTQSVSSSPSHAGGLAYAIDWNLALQTFIPAVGQGQITKANTNEAHGSGLGKFVSQAVSTDAGTKYIMYGHLCSLGVTVGQNLYQGQYVGRSGNTGTVIPAPGTACVNTEGQHLHLQFDNSGTGEPLSSWQFGQTTADQVSRHSATQASLPLGHVSLSNNAGPGFPAFNGNSGGSPTPVDGWISNSYVARVGLNYGSTMALGLTTFTPCNVSSRWVHGCTFGSRTGIAQTFESPQGHQRALLRKSNTTAVYSVQRDILYAYHFWAVFLGFPSAEESVSGGQTIQFFESGWIRKTTSPCETKVFDNVGVLRATFSGSCN